jgi:maleylpyruvate isomerase
MTADPLGLSEDIGQATNQLLDTVRTIEDVSAPSLLPGWTLGHVATHIARNADGAANLLTWASTGVVTPQYASLEARNSDIEAGAGRPVAEQLDDLVQAADRLSRVVAQVPAEAWSRRVRMISGNELPAAGVMWARLREVEIHHVDLGLAYTANDWPAAFALRMAHMLATDLTRRASFPPLVIRAPEIGRDLRVGAAADVPIVSGPVRAAVAWLIGRSDGAGLLVEPTGLLPVLPAWS